MPESSVTVTTPTTIAEFRRLANAFLTGSRFPAGTTVYVVASTAGTRPIQAIVNASSDTAYDDVQAALAVTALSLGEVSAGKLVNPPFRAAYILRLFDQMHYGTDSTVAALCLLQVAVTVVLAALLVSAFTAPNRPRVS